MEKNNEIAIYRDIDINKTPVSDDVDKTMSHIQVDELHYEANESELLGKMFKTSEEAYEVYNLHALKQGFGTRRNRIRRNHNEIIGKDFVCSKQGYKPTKGKQNKRYTRLDIRTGCDAMLYVEYNKSSDIWTVKEHKMAHNHAFIDPSHCHRLRSHRKVTREDMDFLFTMKQSGLKIVEAVKVLKGIHGGSPYVGFLQKDAYNALNEKHRSMFQGADAHCLVQMFQKRQLSENDFFYDFEVDEECKLCSFFWRDARMKQDYKIFGDVIIFDTTYKTNKYDMICAPFIGMSCLVWMSSLLILVVMD